MENETSCNARNGSNLVRDTVSWARRSFCSSSVTFFVNVECEIEKKVRYAE
jgi:hypothetical protein